MKPIPYLHPTAAKERWQYWMDVCDEVPELKRYVELVQPRDGDHRKAHCLFCGAYHTSRSLHSHAQTPECQAKRNTLLAVEQGLLDCYKGYYAGHVVSASWAKPFLQRRQTGVDGLGREAQLSNRYWAPRWWLQLAYETKRLSTVKRAELMNEVLDLWRAGNMQAIDNIQGMLELAND